MLPSNTEPIIQYNAGTERRDLKFGALDVHDFTNTTGVQQIVAADEISIFLLGSGVTVTDVWEGERQRQHTYAAGDLILLPARSEVRAAYVSNTYSETMVRLPMDVLKKVAGEVVNVDALDIRYGHFDVNAQFGITAAVRNIARSDIDTPAMPLLIESMTTALAAGVLCGLSLSARAKLENLVQGLSERRLRMTLDYIEANLDTDLSLLEIAGAAALSPHHFSRSFKARMGTSPVRYVWGRRVERAKWMLSRTGEPIANIALACGFSAQSHFTTLFKQTTGKTPAAWRRSA